MKSVAGVRWSWLINASNSLLAKGEETPVISGSVPPHLTRGSGPDQLYHRLPDIVFDGGFADKAEAESYGIRPGDTIIIDNAILTSNGKNVISRSLGQPLRRHMVSNWLKLYLVKI